MDFSQLESALALASTALGTTGKAVTTIEAVKKLIRTEKQPDDSTDKQADNTKAVNLLNTLATELTAANMMNVQLSEALRELSRDLRRQDDFENEKARYELFRTGLGDVVFKLKADAAEGQPEHFVCPVCLKRDRFVSYVTGNSDIWRCQTDRNHLFRFSSTPRQTRAVKGMF